MQRICLPAALAMTACLAVLAAQVPAPRHLVVCGWDEVFILDMNSTKTPLPERLWTWRARDRRDLPEEFRPLFNATDECKPYEGGARILITSSGGGVALVDRAADRVLFYGRAANAHSAELLPGNRLAVAASHDRAGQGDRLILFDAARSDRELWTDELPWGHGVVWDAERQLLWALADEDIRVYELRGWASAEPSLQRVALIPLPEGGGHDLSPVPGTPHLAVTTKSRCWLFERDARTFQPHPQLADRAGVKGISYHPVTGEIAYVEAEGGNWWAERIRFRNPDATLRVPGQHFYKARWILP